MILSLLIEIPWFVYYIYSHVGQTLISLLYIYIYSHVGQTLISLMCISGFISYAILKKHCIGAIHFFLSHSVAAPEIFFRVFNTKLEYNITKKKK